LRKCWVNVVKVAASYKLLAVVAKTENSKVFVWPNEMRTVCPNRTTSVEHALVQKYETHCIPRETLLLL